MRVEEERGSCLESIAYGFIGVSSVILTEAVGMVSGAFVYDVLRYNRVPEFVAGCAGVATLLLANWFVLGGAGLFDKKGENQKNIDPV